MDEKTAHLREIFMNVAGDSTITEHQQESRGALVGESEIDDRLHEIITEMNVHYEFSTSLSPDQLVTVIKRFFAGDRDTEIAQFLDGEIDSGTVRRARIALHLVTDDDQNAPFELGELQELLDAEYTIADIAERLAVSSSTVRRYKQVSDALRDRKAVNDEYRMAFEQILDDHELSDRFTEDVRDTGLEDATDGMESNVSF